MGGKKLALVLMPLPTATQADQGNQASQDAPGAKGLSEWEVFHRCPQLPVLEVVKHAIQHGLRLREQLCKGLEQGDAHNVEEPKLQLQASRELKRRQHSVFAKLWPVLYVLLLFVLN